MTANKSLRVQIHPTEAETEARTWSIADTERITNQLERVIYRTILNEQKRLKKEFSIHKIEFEAWWETIRI